MEYTNSRPNLKIVRQSNLDYKVLLHRWDYVFTTWWLVCGSLWAQSPTEKGVAADDLFIFSVLVFLHPGWSTVSWPGSERCNTMWVSNLSRSHSQLLPGCIAVQQGPCLSVRAGWGGHPATGTGVTHRNRNIKKWERKHMGANFTSCVWQFGTWTACLAESPRAKSNLTHVWFSSLFLEAVAPDLPWSHLTTCPSSYFYGLQLRRLMDKTMYCLPVNVTLHGFMGQRNTFDILVQVFFKSIIWNLCPTQNILSVLWFITFEMSSFDV